MDPASSIFRLAALAWVVIFTCDNAAGRSGTFVTASALSPRQLEKEALLTTGWWNNSLSPADYSLDHCQWIGITCNSAGGIIRLHLSGNNVHYSSVYDVDFAQAQLSQLNFSCFPNLENLTIQLFPLTGSIPSDISALSKLQLLDLSSNWLIGTNPSALGRLTNLKNMILSRNQLSGLLPHEIGNLKNLIELDVGGNGLIGPIPSTLGRLTNLNYMSLSRNMLGGLPPQEIGNLKNLIELNVSSNSLIGPIPQTLGRLTNLSYLDLSCNQFNNSIPNELARLTNLLGLDLSSNKLSGKIPLEVASMRYLNKLDLSNNNIKGSIPVELTKLSRLDYLNLSANELSGLVSFSNEQLSSIYLVSLSPNKGLCGNSNSLPACHTSDTAKLLALFIEIFFPITVVIIFARLLLVKLTYKKPELKGRATNSIDVFSVWNYDGRIVYEDLIEATEDFDIKYLLA